MRNLKSVLVIPAVLFFLMTVGCDNENSGNANAQPAPMSGTDVTGTVNAPSAQTCPADILIDGLEADDVLVIEVNSTGAMMGDATITNSTKSTSASCAGVTDDSLPPAEVKRCKVSSSTIPGFTVGDEIGMSIVFSVEGKQVTLEAPGPDSITCAFVTIETLNATH